MTRPWRTVAGTGPAGTALVFDGRIWHGTGANITADDRRYGVLTYFCRPWMRPQENYTLSTHPDVLGTARRRAGALLGLRGGGPSAASKVRGGRARPRPVGSAPTGSCAAPRTPSASCADRNPQLFGETANFCASPKS